MIPPLRNKADKVVLFQEYVGGRCRIERDETWVKMVQTFVAYLSVCGGRCWRSTDWGQASGHCVPPASGGVAIVRAQIANLPQSCTRIGHIGLSVHEGGS